MAKLDLTSIPQEELHLTPRVGRVEEWFEDALNNGMSVPALSLFAAFCKLLLNADGIVEIRVPEAQDLLEYTLSIDSPRPGVIRFMLTEPE